MALHSFFVLISIKYTDSSKGPFVFVAIVCMILTESLKLKYGILSKIAGKNSGLARLVGHFRYNLFFTSLPIGTVCEGITCVFTHLLIKDLDPTATEFPKIMKHLIKYP